MINLDYIPPEWGIPIGIVLWVILFGMILWDRWKIKKIENRVEKLSQLKIRHNGEWVPLTDELYNLYHTPQGIFDQDELKKEHS